MCLKFGLKKWDTSPSDWVVTVNDVSFYTSITSHKIINPICLSELTYGILWWTAARQRGRGWARLSVSASVPRRPQQGRGERGLRVPAQMRSIHFPSSAYGGPLSSATEAEVMQFVGMSCHFTNCPSHWDTGQQKTSKGSLLFGQLPTITGSNRSHTHTPKHYTCICLHLHKYFDEKSEKAGSVEVNLSGDYNIQYLCQSLLFFRLWQKLILIYRIRFSRILALRHDSLLIYIMVCKDSKFGKTRQRKTTKHCTYNEIKSIIERINSETTDLLVRVNWAAHPRPVPGFTMPCMKLLSDRRGEGVLFNFLKKQTFDMRCTI